MNVDQATDERQTAHLLHDRHGALRRPSGPINWTTSAAAILLAAVSTATAETTAARPNILVIVSDDQGCADVGFHGCRDIPTPHLDRLASEGVRCTHGYASNPSRPTRSAFTTHPPVSPTFDPACARFLSDRAPAWAITRIREWREMVGPESISGNGSSE